MPAPERRHHRPRVLGRPSLRRALTAWLMVLPALACFGLARADMVLHEYLQPDPAEDLTLGITTVDGAMAGAIQTTSGAVAAPDPSQPPAPSEPSYGVGAGATPRPSLYRVDGNTTQPASSTYHDPFTPTVTPFKRVQAYDSVSSELDLTVAHPARRRLPVGGKALAGDDQFYADLQVDLLATEPVRVPSVGPGARVLALEVTPPTAVELLVDGVDAWFVRGSRAGRVRLVMHLAIDRSSFDEHVFRSSAEPLAQGNLDATWRQLRARLPPLPPEAQRAGLEVASQLGISSQQSPSQTLAQLVEHFRSFAPSTELPQATGAGLYAELALSRKGVCRHRAYAFVVTALALGLPARMVVNEAHAWVEVSDGNLWHRIDLGGAVGELIDSTEARPAHVPPADAFAWPPDSTPGAALAARRGAGGASTPSPATQAPPGNPATPPPGTAPVPPSLPPGAPGAPGAAGAAADEAPSELAEEDLRPLSRVTLRLAEAEAHRGDRVRVSGRVTAGDEPCRYLRVDLALALAPPSAATAATPAARAGTASSAPAADPRAAQAPGSAPALALPWRRIPLTALVTGDDGSFEGRVVIPFTLGVGDYQLVATTPGGARCGPGSSE